MRKRYLYTCRRFMKKKDIIDEVVARLAKWLDEQFETYDDTYTTAEVASEAIIEIAADLTEPFIAPPDKEATFNVHPYKGVLKDSIFYRDEAYAEGEQHANICDTCSNPAQYMTFSTPKNEGSEEGSAYYICEDCVEAYGMEHKIEEV